MYLKLMVAAASCLAAGVKINFDRVSRGGGMVGAIVPPLPRPRFRRDDHETKNMRDKNVHSCWLKTHGKFILFKKLNSFMDIEKCINQFLEGNGKNKGRNPDERYASFDFCYNYFYSFYRQNKITELASEKNIQMSCLQLGFYLASWGMMRGSSFLLEKSVKNYETLIRTISKMDPKLWEIDVDKYDDRKNIELLLDCKQKIIEALDKNNRPSDILITKIMLGVFANVPAFDTYVGKSSLKLHTFNKHSLTNIKKFYEENKSILDSFKIHTYDFLTSQETDVMYTKAKLIDMCGVIDGQP